MRRITHNHSTFVSNDAVGKDEKNSSTFYVSERLSVPSSLQPRKQSSLLNIRMLPPRELLLTTAAVAKKGFVPFTEIPSNPNAINSLLGTGTLTKVELRAEDTIGNANAYSLQKNGFEFHHLPEECCSILDTLIADSTNRVAREKFRNTLATYVETLAKNKWGYKTSMKAVPLDAVLRDTAPTKSSSFGAVGLIHSDFPKNLKKTVVYFSDTWGPRFEAKKIDSETVDFPGMVNIWMPLDDHVKADPLVLMDKRSSSAKSMKLYTAVRRDSSKFEAQVVEDNHQPIRAHYLSSFGKGDCVIFDSTKTPHSAVEIPGQGSTGRRSLEVRVIFVE